MQLRLHALGPSQYIEYAEFGDPQGKPAVFFHGFVGSIHQARAAHQAAAELGLRIIAPHRPGVGRSTPVSGRSIHDAVQPAFALLRQLNIDSYAAIGVSGGAPYAVACAVLDAQRVRRLVLVSPLGPLGQRHIRRAMRSRLRGLLAVGSMGGVGRRTISGLFSIKHRLFARNLRSEVLRFVQTVSPADIGRFSENIEGALDMFVDDHAVILATQDAPRHLSIEIQRYWNWGFHVGHLSVPCRIWHGADDVMVPQASAEYFHARFPEADYRLIPGGHFASLGYLRDIVAFATGRREAD